MSKFKSWVMDEQEEAEMRDKLKEQIIEKIDRAIDPYVREPLDLYKASPAAYKATGVEHMQGLIDALESYQKVDDELVNFTRGFGDGPRVDERSIARKALAKLPAEWRK